MFSVENFLDQQFDQANDTVSQPVPAGEFPAIIDKVECKQWASKADPSKAGLKLAITWLIDDGSVKELLGRDKVTVRQDIMLDMTDAGGLDMGKGRNISLGRLREATGLNTQGQPFSFAMLTGRCAKVKVDHRIADDKIYAEVKGVARM